MTELNEKALRLAAWEALLEDSGAAADELEVWHAKLRALTAELQDQGIVDAREASELRMLANKTYSSYVKEVLRHEVLLLNANNSVLRSTYSQSVSRGSPFLTLIKHSPSFSLARPLTYA